MKQTRGYTSWSSSNPGSTRRLRPWQQTPLRSASSSTRRLGGGHRTARHRGNPSARLAVNGLQPSGYRAAHELGLTVVRVPAYSPNAVDEFTVGMILALDRKCHRAHNRVRTGTSRWKACWGSISTLGRSASLEPARSDTWSPAYGPASAAGSSPPTPTRTDETIGLGVEYMDFHRLLGEADIITLHSPLTPETQHLIDRYSLGYVRPGAMLINTSRGALVDTEAVMDVLKDGRLRSLGARRVLGGSRSLLRRLGGSGHRRRCVQPTPHLSQCPLDRYQAFFTHDALTQIAETTECRPSLSSSVGRPRATRSTSQRSVPERTRAW